ncbi:hypothetical protein AVEN_86981-1, partial [Araneus ventricosus]
CLTKCIFALINKLYQNIMFRCFLKNFGRLEEAKVINQSG